MSIVVKQISYIHPDKEYLFRDINFSISKGQKIALVGRNGSGKSTLLQILSGHLQAAAGEATFTDIPFYIPQHFGQYDKLTVAQALGIDLKITALRAIIAGDASIANFSALEDDWAIEERVFEALSLWDISYVTLDQLVGTLSGGEKTKVFLSRISIYSPAILLFDEPSNHLDADSRDQLYNFIQTYKATMVVVSHDRNLLNLIDFTYELNPDGIIVYGGNYEFYKMQKEEKINALEASVDYEQKALRHAKQIARAASERKQKENSRGNKKQLKKGVPRIYMNTLKNGAEQSTSRLKEVHSEKITGILNNLQQVRQQLPEDKELQMNFEQTNLHTGKVLVTAQEINFRYDTDYLWKSTLTFQIRSGDRIAIVGNNGAGKTTILKLILGKIKPSTGTLTIAGFQHIYIDQEYSIINNELTVIEQVQEFNTQHFPEHMLKTTLHQFLFPVEMWDKPCLQLSGGEKIKLIFCCLTISNSAPDMIILDEPTNNLDIRSLEIITSAVKNYSGTLLVISHDRYFLNEIGVDRTLSVNRINS